MEDYSGKPNPTRGGIITAFVLILLAIFYIFFFSAPADFKTGVPIKIEPGTSISEAAAMLKKESLIRFEGVFKALVVVFGGRTGVAAGVYVFEKPVSVFEVAGSIIFSGSNSHVFKITIPEGLSNAEVADILTKNLEDFDREKFLALARVKEGYLFPDTYFFQPYTSPEDVVKAMNKNFEDKMTSIKSYLNYSKRTLKQIIIMASLLEGEARTDQTRKMVSGILWKRLDADMPLQVDTVFKYIMNKGSSELTLDDLQFDSPYNTYKYIGLPPAPISNPGLNTILAAIYPTSSQYFFYLSDKDGNMYYATTFEGHKANKLKYIR